MRVSSLISLGRYWIYGGRWSTTDVSRNPASRFSVPESSSAGGLDSGQPLHCRTASCQSDFQASFELLYESYHLSGLCPFNRTGLRVLPIHLRPETQVFVGEHQGTVRGTISLVLDEGDGLPLETVFRDHVQLIRDAGRRVAEFTSLAIAPAQSQNSTRSFSQLTAVAVAFARRHGIDEVLAAVHPRHARFYSRAMGFRCLSDAVPYAGVLNHPAVLIAVSIDAVDRVKKRWRNFYGHSTCFTDQSLLRRPMSNTTASHFSRYLTQINGGQAAQPLNVAQPATRIQLET